MTEFELIARYFDRPVPPGGAVARGIGDDCAILDFGGATQLAVTTDMLIEGRHFSPSDDPESLGHKTLAVNLSDLAAAGAQPRCFFLFLGLRVADAPWLEAFSRGLLRIGEAFGCVLAGGDTTRVPTSGGPVTLGVTAIGEVPREGALTRAGARAGDDIWISGELGGAALALTEQAGAARLSDADASAVRARLQRPEPRVALGIALRGLATACIDVSDGLVGDIGHILARSKVGAAIEWAAVPRSSRLRAQAPEIELRCALAGGDDYELAFTAPPSRRDAVLAAAEAARTSVTRVGVITEGRDLVIRDDAGRPMDMPFKAYDHFASNEPAQ